MANKDHLKIGGPNVTSGRPGQLHIGGILHFNTGNGLDWRNIGPAYWKLFNQNMITISNYIKQDPNYPNYFTSYNLVSPAVNNYNTGLSLVSGSQFGKIYIAGSNNGMRIYDPTTQSYATVAIQSGTLTGTVQTCVLLYDKTVCNIPAPTTSGTSSTITIYDPNLGKIYAKNTRIACNTTSIPDYWASIMLPSPPGTTPGITPGKVFLPPYGVAYPGIYDPTTDTITQVTNVDYTTYLGTGYAFYRDCALLPSGKIFMVPNSATAAAIYDPITQQSTFLQAPSFGSFSNLWGSGRYYHAVTLLDGRVFCAPYLATGTARPAIIYDEISNTLSLTTPIDASVRKAILLPDGRVFCIPVSTRDNTLGTNLRAAIYDPATNTSSYFDITGVTSSATNPANDFYRAAIMQYNGQVYAPVGSASNALVFDTLTYSFDWNVLASAYHNGR